eukprot:TRINITY_DN1916_c0_g1_i4.p1 TRINITY_DN1916_c0_g1~~TRINITY_DN1916_c0_g1_i4.p1  ORF type:complete len:301 (+),score=117.58 TRINITY_DN1916_c0_g1_i4:102-1004(+)
MSKVIPFLSASKCAAFDGASKVLSKVGVSFKQVEHADMNGVCMAGGLARSELDCLKVHTTIRSTGAAAKLNPDATYNDADFSVVRSLGVATADAVPVTEKVDKFAKLGIDTSSDVELLRANIAKTVQAAIELAAETGASRITVFQKPQSAFKEHNTLFVNTVKEAAEKAEVSVEVVNSQQLSNAAVMFSKNLGVIVAPDYSASSNFENLASGIAGGAGMASETHKSDNATIFTSSSMGSSSNPTGLLIAATQALKAMGLAAEAGKVQAALEKTYKAGTLPSDVKGGKDSAAFATAVASAC